MNICHPISFLAKLQSALTLTSAVHNFHNLYFNCLLVWDDWTAADSLTKIDIVCTDEQYSVPAMHTVHVQYAHFLLD